MGLRGHALSICVFELNFSSGELLFSTASSFESAKRDAAINAGPVLCAAIDHEYTHLATAGDDKQLKVWAIDGLQLLSERYEAHPPPDLDSAHDRDSRNSEIPKKPTQILFTRSGQTIVVADKFGDVFRCVLLIPPSPSRRHSHTCPPKLPSHTATYNYTSTCAECRT
jgi:tRNA (guanine-N(7)-)-methyltransferase subunit TRM82